ncbi:hypothetical protein RN001_005377 [Aquatica leii]|uniref:CCHC-type domain-containing protein n=1 Tax=Aquatica leii TaxID=1421715 RepID=A0AAN7SPU5_9COLE|nr:hypothetical protein RN001_005377 [Aquatica leii]
MVNGLAPALLSPPNLSNPSTSARTRTTSVSSNRSVSFNVSSEPTNFRYCLRNLPTNIKTQKQLYTSLLSLQLPLTNLKLNFNRTAKIQHLFGDPNINLSQLSRPRSLNLNSNTHSFTCVLRNIDKDITEPEILTAIYLLKLTKAIRIISRLTQQSTTLIRLITPSKTTLDYLLARDVYMYGRHYPCEPSYIPQPVPKYCSTCTKVGHLLDECPTRVLTCPKCGGNHNSSTCLSTEPKCNNCSGPHPTYSFACAVRNAFPQTAAATAHPTAIDTHSESETTSLFEDDVADTDLRLKPFIKTLTLSLMYLFPDRRNKIIKAINRTTTSILNCNVYMSFVKSGVAFTFKQHNT